jgi:NCS1 family nucleobase:cation symporter-1
VVSAVLRTQQKFVGFLARMFPQLGDITFFAGFVIAAECYLMLARSRLRSESVRPLTQ